MLRRDFLRMGRGAGIVLLGSTTVGNMLLSTACNNPVGPEPPEEVNIQLNVYKHMQGLANTIVKRGYTNSVLQVAFNELGVDGVSSMYMVARKPNMGARMGITSNGVLGVQTDNSTIYDIHCFSYDGSSDSDFAAIAGANPVLRCGSNPRDSKWFRKDFDGVEYRGFQAEWEHAFAQVNNAFRVAYPVGSCSPFGGVDGTDWSYGCGFTVADGDKSDDRKAIWVNNVGLHNSSYAITGTAIAELWEVLGRINNPFGGPVGDQIINGTTLNTRGVNTGRFYMIWAE